MPSAPCACVHGQVLAMIGLRLMHTEPWVWKPPFTKVLTASSQKRARAG